MIIESIYDNKSVKTGTIRVTHYDRNGRIKKTHSQDVDSFVINNWRVYVYGIHTGVGTRLNWDAGGAQDAYNSIIVGSGANAVTYSDTALQTQILHGNTTGRLRAYAPTATYDSSTGALTLTRQFENLFNPSTVSVSECGIRVNTGNSTSSTGGLLIVRDVLSTTYSIVFGDRLVIDYDIILPYGLVNYNYLFTRHLIGRTNDNMVLINQSGTTIEGSFGASDSALNFITELSRDDRGIVIGTSSTSPSFADYALGSKISNGSNSGEMIYGSSTASTNVSNTTTNTTEWYITRWFKNESGSSISVSEVGLSSNATIASTNAVFLFDRRVFGSPVTVNDGEILTVNWKFKYTF